MIISKVTIRNFRSIKAASFAPSVFNVFVGQNNHGKTNVFEALSWFHDGGGDTTQLVYGQVQGETFSVEVEFNAVQAGLDLMKNAANRTTLKERLAGQDTLRVIRNSTEPKKRQIWLDGKWSNPGTGFDKALDDALPRFEYVRTSTHLADVAAYKKNSPIGQMLSGVLSVILEKSEQYREFRKQFDRLFADDASDVKVTLDNLSGQVKVHLEQQFPDCTKVTFEVSQPAFDDLLKNFDTTVNDGIETLAHEKGDGMQRALMLAIIKTYAEQRKANEGKNFIFLLDEAEVHLHPTAQRQLKEVLLAISGQGDQVLINTHSSVLIADDGPNQSNFRVKKTHGQTSVSPVTAKEKGPVVYELLGGSPADLLLPPNFMIVEGHSDCLFLQKVIQRHYADRPDILIVAAGGDTVKQAASIDALQSFFVPLHLSPIYRDRVTILCDQPNATQVAKLKDFNAKFPNLAKQGQLFVLENGSIEECYPNPWKKTSTEVANMSHNAKRELAAQAGESISKAEFEAEMPTLHKALEFTWQRAY